MRERWNQYVTEKFVHQRDLRKMVLGEMSCLTTCVLTLSVLRYPDTPKWKFFLENDERLLCDQKEVP